MPDRIVANLHQRQHTVRDNDCVTTAESTSERGHHCSTAALVYTHTHTWTGACIYHTHGQRSTLLFVTCGHKDVQLPLHKHQTRMWMIDSPVPQWKGVAVFTHSAVQRAGDHAVRVRLCGTSCLLVVLISLQLHGRNSTNPITLTQPVEMTCNCFSHRQSVAFTD